MQSKSAFGIPGQTLQATENVPTRMFPHFEGLLGNLSAGAVSLAAMRTWRHPFEVAPFAVVPHGVPARLDVTLDAGDLALIRTLRPETSAMWVATGGSALCSIAVYC